jgi:hypothetical protein
MKVRAIKMPKGNFVPEYKDENGKFGPQWRECHLSNDLVAISYWTEEEAKNVCIEYANKRKAEDGEVVWETEI